MPTDTTRSYFKYSQLEIIREMKQDFLICSEDPLQSMASEASRITNYELPDGNRVQMSDYERKSLTEKLFLNQTQSK